MAVLPRSADELAAWYAAHPDATLIAGATDVGLWVTKALRDLPRVAFLHRARDLARIEAAAPPEAFVGKRYAAAQMGSIGI